MKAIIALVGRPNVGKSTLFNRLSVRNKAIVHDTPGVTRDRKYSDAKLGPLSFTVIDTPGLEQSEKAAIEERMMGQTFTAVATADLVLFIVDGPAGITPQDKFFANLLRRQNNNVILIANKCERGHNIDKEFYKLGFGDPVKISAAHGLGMADLCEILLPKLSETDDKPEDPFKSDIIQIAVCGRPNAGKSTFINNLIQEDRLLTGPEAGITRDAIEIKWQYKGKNIKLIDTAGVRKRGKIDFNLEKLSVGETLHSIRYANTVILMVDAELGVEQQDLNLINFVIEEGRSIVLVLNKWDLIKNKAEYKEEMEYRLKTDISYIKGVEVLYISSLDHSNIKKVIDSCIKAYEVWNVKISTSKLNEWLEFATEYQQLPLIKNGRRVRLKYMLQTKSRPPTFKFFTNYPKEITDSYKKYLTNSLRSHFGLAGTPIRLVFEKTENPYAKKK